MKWTIEGIKDHIYLLENKIRAIETEKMRLYSELGKTRDNLKLERYGFFVGEECLYKGHDFMITGYEKWSHQPFRGVSKNKDGTWSKRKTIVEDVKYLEKK